MLAGHLSRGATIRDGAPPQPSGGGGPTFSHHVLELLSTELSKAAPLAHVICGKEQESQDAWVWERRAPSDCQGT